MALSSIQVEKHVLAGLLQNPQIIGDVEPFLKEQDFRAEPHNVIYGCIRTAFTKNEQIDKVLIGQRISSLGISFKDDINIFDYIESISFAPITPEATRQACQELVKLRVLRNIKEQAQRIVHYVENSVTQDIGQTVAKVDSMYSQTMNSFEKLSEPEEMFFGLAEQIEERGNNPIEEVGLLTPFPEFNRLYGGFRDGNVYAIASRPGQGKTTWLNYLAAEMGRTHKIPVLLLDTEMVTEEVKFRTAAAFSGVPLWYLETGQWRKHPDMVTKVRTHLKNLKDTYKVYHYYVGGRPIEEVISIIRRWYLSVVGRGARAIVSYDYIKLTGERITANWAEHQAIGDKFDRLKDNAKEFGYPFLTAIQLNRTGENTGRDSKMVIDDASAIAGSDKVMQLTTYLGIFRQKMADEIVLDTIDSGTHKLIDLKARFQGKDAAGHHNLILREFPDGTKKYVRNYINFSVENFHVQERGSLRDSIARQHAQFLVEDAPKKGVEVQEETL